MRRVLSILLFVATLLPLLLPMLSSTATAETDVPVCCRRGGRHHCMMNGQPGMAAPAGQVMVRALCAACPYPQRSLAVGHQPGANHTTAGACIAVVDVPMPLATQVECLRRISFDRSRQKRGPPPSLIS